jgi:hypothetical protein|tara:strand:- start:58 stop:210 length:153 start_codon:yes stop_codon:yes gene_type:complete
MIKKIEKINPIAKSLRDRLYRKRVIQDKREKQRDKLHKKDIRDGKTSQDS